MEAVHRHEQTAFQEQHTTPNRANRQLNRQIFSAHPPDRFGYIVLDFFFQEWENRLSAIRIHLRWDIETVGYMAMEKYPVRKTIGEVPKK